MNSLDREQFIANNQPEVDFKCAFRKGQMFEEYISALFDKKSGRFEFLNASSTNAPVYGINAAQSLFPDLKILCGIRRKKYKFAIECKWREQFTNGKIHWATADQIQNYLNYQRGYRIPVYVAIGIGGQPSKPEKLFVTPLLQISEKVEVAEEHLMLFQRKTTRGFFYDAKQLKLF